MKILHVCNHFYPCIGGIERYVFDMSKELMKAGHISDVACLNTCAYKRDLLSEKEKIEGIAIYRMPYLNLKYYKIAPSVLKLVKEYDIIHIQGIGFFSDFLSATKAIHKKPIILSTHGGIFHTNKISGIKNAYFSTIARIALKNVNAVIATGKNDYELFSRISKNVEFIPPGIDYNKFSKISRRTKKNTFLFVGRISKNKRIDNLIRTVSILKKSIPVIKLYVAGDDWDGSVKELQSLSRKLNVDGNVIFAGRLSDSELMKHYSFSQFFVSASEYEGFGISVAEAMASGCIPILNDIIPFRSFIGKNNGLIVDFNNPEEASKKISAIMGENLEKIMQNSISFAKKYSWDEKIYDIEQIYLKSINGKWDKK